MLRLLGPVIFLKGRIRTQYITKFKMRTMLEHQHHKHIHIYNCKYMKIKSGPSVFGARGGGFIDRLMVRPPHGSTASVSNYLKFSGNSSSTQNGASSAPAAPMEYEQLLHRNLYPNLQLVMFKSRLRILLFC